MYSWGRGIRILGRNLFKNAKDLVDDLRRIIILLKSNVSVLF